MFNNYQISPTLKTHKLTEQYVFYTSVNKTYSIPW